MYLLEKTRPDKKIRELSFQEIILNNTKNRLINPVIPSLLKINKQEFAKYRKYIEYLIDTEFRVGAKSKPDIRDISSEMIIKIKREVKEATKDCLRALKNSN